MATISGNKLSMNIYLHNKSNYRIATWVVAKPFDCIVLEALRGIKTNSKKQKRVGKQTRKRFANWAYYQLERLVVEKALEAGKMVLFVNPKYTSQRCSRCGRVARSNRSGPSSRASGAGSRSTLTSTPRGICPNVALPCSGGWKLTTRTSREMMRQNSCRGSQWQAADFSRWKLTIRQ